MNAPNTKHANETRPMLTAERRATAIYQAPSDYLDKPDAIVIGSGIGGLGVASFLAQRRGMRVLVLEANVVPGGCTHVHEIDGFEFPSGLDSVGDMDAAVGRGMNRPNMDAATGGKLAWAKMPDVHEICTFGDDVYEWHSSPEANLEWLDRRFPGDGDVRGYYQLEDRVEANAWAWALTKLYPEWMPEGMRDMLYKTTGRRWRNAMRENAMSVLTRRLGFSPKLAAVFSYMYGNYGRLPHDAPFGMHATFLAHYRHGAYYPVGGPGQIAQCIVPIVEGAGGQVAVRSAVAKILVENNRAIGVRLENGAEIRAPLVISDAGAHTTFVELLDPEIAAAHGLVQRFAGVRSSPAHLYLMLGFDEPLDLPKHIVWHMPRGAGLDPYDLAAADARWKDAMRFEDMACYILSPSARDPAHAQRYPNKSTIMALAECRPEWVERIRRDKKLEADFVSGVAASLGDIIARYAPAIRGKTPALVRAGAPMGCNPRAWNAGSYGVELAPERFFAQTHWLRPRTPIKGLFLTGQDAFLPGICGSLLAARFTYAAAASDPLFLLAH
ncbi:MAG: NAD(P)/FAD-dependent oxidoreductase [Deltaproteobacteria bacterium]|nr:NAD(P)/FAD-dependent oxidoreductase [Deltaproteobacteria bacterium]